MFMVKIIFCIFKSCLFVMISHQLNLQMHDSTLISNLLTVHMKWFDFNLLLYMYKLLHATKLLHLK